MAVKEIADDHHVLRHCRARLIDTSDLNNLQPFPEAFELRAGEKYLSASYYEYFQGSHNDKLAKALQSLAGRFQGIKRKDALLMMNAGEIRSCGTEYETKVRVVHQPTKDAPDYAGIRGIPSPPIAALNALLANLAVRDVVLIEDVV